MNYQIEIPVAELKGVALFAGDDVVRPYLNGVLITADKGKAVAVGCDGHRLTAFKSDADYSGPDFIIPAEQIKALKVNRGLPCCALSYDDESRLVKIFHNGMSEQTAIDGNYPDWRRAVPLAPSGELPPNIGFDAAYLADYARLRKVIGSRFTSIHIKPNGSSGARISIGDPRFVCVLMGTRDDFTPTWIDDQANSAEEKVA